jgi:hypothetical protein
MKQPHHCQAKAYHDYYLFQAGRGYPLYVVTRYQRVHGLGSIFGGLFKAAVPFLKKGAKTLGREALKTGLNIAEDVVAGKNLKQAAKSRLKSTGQNLLQKAIIGVGPPGERYIKRAAKRKNPRRRKTKLRNTSKDIFGYKWL